jgi:glycosyltransferase involved in cell wall biosynthesis
MPLISVIIPVYNGESTIRETLESVLRQSFQNFEIIIINDGSTDHTLEIVNSIKDVRIKIFSYLNSGLSVSRNRGLGHAKGEYITFLDADDLWTSDKLEVQLRTLKQAPEAALVYSWSDRIDEYSKPIGKGGHISVNGNALPYLLLTDILENGSNPLIKAEIFSSVGPFNECLLAAEDWELWLRIAARYPFVSVPKSQVLYRISSSSLSSNTAKMEYFCLMQ